ncbi:hypothetical protein NKI25_20295 [Mesorhizobium sp. M0808]|uniref:hypothetical protein n=1 Tax=Mesorhizobium sp. M0808 TaxID=2957002 RepID=UPI003336CED9
MLSTILNARPMVRRLIALAIAAAVTCTAGWMVFITFDSIALARAGIEEKREILGQLQAVAALAKRVNNEKCGDNALFAMFARLSLSAPLPHGATSFALQNRTRLRLTPAYCPLLSTCGQTRNNATNSSAHPQDALD